MKQKYQLASMVRVPSQLSGIFRSAMSGRFNRSIASQRWVVCTRLLGFLAHRPARGQAHAMLDGRLLGVGVNPRVDRVVADRAVSVGGSIHGGQRATRFSVQPPAYLARCVPLG